MLKKLSFIFILLFGCGIIISAQQKDYFEIDTLTIHTTVKPKEHLIGFRYSYAITGVNFTPDLKQKGVNTPLNFALLYTYYHPLWGYMDYFGLQTGVRYGSQGFTTEYNLENMDQTITTIEVPISSAFHYNVGNHVRLMFSAGCFGGYRYKTTKEGGFDCYDRRYDYGLVGGAGFAIKFSPIEIHFEGSYQYSFSFLYHPEKFSNDWWIYSYPYQICISVGIHFKL